MLYLWYLWLRNWQPGGYAPANPVFRATLAVLTGFFIVWLLGPWVIRTLTRMKIGDQPEFDHEALNRATRDKANTPTMGGVLIVLAIGATVLLLADLRSFYVALALFCLIWLATLGGMDDWLKLTAGRRFGTRSGLRMWEKLVFQIALGVLLAIFIDRYAQSSLLFGRFMDPNEPYRSDLIPFTPDLNQVILPFYKGDLELPRWAYYLTTVIVIVGTSNAVNLTDGMDGLASGCMVLTSLAFLIFAVVVGSQDIADFRLFPYIRGASELAVLCGALVGACLGFLWYNAYPARVFMGDTGSLPLGGLIGYVAVVTRLESMLLIIGGIFVIEAASVLLQVGYYKATGGKRIFRCAPLHHHYHLGGLTETQVVVRFWLVGALFTAFAVLTIWLR